MSEIRNVPEIRFKGFKDDWKQRELGAIGETKSGVGFPDCEQGGDRGIPFLKVSDMNNLGNEHEMHNSNNYVTNKQILENKWKPIDKVPSIIFAKVGAAIMLNRKRLVREPFLIDNNTMAYIFDDSWEDYFGKTKFETIYLPKFAQVGALPSYNGNDIEAIKIYRPNKLEQKNIGQFFQRIDNLITLHQRKYDQIVNFKKAMLKKMFPKDGSDIPEIRFKEFNKKDINAWEKKNFGDMVDFFSGLTYNPNYVKKEGTLVLRSSNVKNGEIVSADNVFVDSEVVNSKNVEFGDVIVVVRNGSRDLIGKHAQIKKDMPNTVIGAFMTGIRSERPDFISAILDTDNFDKEISKNMGATINQITGKMFMDMNFVIPSEEEQIKIGAFFRKLDDLILLYYQKLQKLKHIKKALLEKMFV